MALSAAHFHVHCGRGSAKLMCALYFSGHGPSIPRLTRSLQTDLKELKNFVTDIQTDRQRTGRQTTDDRRQTKRFIVSRMRCYVLDGS
ncbi:hypothetical protein V3C99_017868 [Haemonchus contortus]|uniref:Uncharacterized protein n=1 Tax=Haemonchus contortus TaxID=6289 RepID=A0A7I4Z3T6_HAECO